MYIFANAYRRIISRTRARGHLFSVAFLASLFGVFVVRSNNPFSHRIPGSGRVENFIKARSAIEISGSVKREEVRAKPGKEEEEEEEDGGRGGGGEKGSTRPRLMPHGRCNADNPALLISRSNLPGTCSVITSRRRITFLARISAK